MQTCFISYQREDKPIADRVYQRLKQYGIDVWMDKPQPDLDLTLTAPLPSGLAFVSAEDVHDGHQLTIHSVENLEIRPKGSDLVHLHVSPRYAFALDFHDCRNVRLDRLRMGHQPETGSCIGGVLQGQKVRNLAVSDCILYGCGTSGFELSDAEQVTIDRCVVEECTSHLSSFRFCTGVAVRETVFRRNEIWGGLRFENCGQIEVRESGFEDNRRVWHEQIAMISAHRSRDIWFRDCWAHGNDFAAVEANTGSVQFSHCRWE